MLEIIIEFENIEVEKAFWGYSFPVLSFPLPVFDFHQNLEMIHNLIWYCVLNLVFLCLLLLDTSSAEYSPEGYTSTDLHANA